MQQTYYNVISPLRECQKECPCSNALPTPFRHSHMNQYQVWHWSEEEKEDINRKIVKTKASWLLERYSSSTFLPFSLLLSHILFSTDLLWISPTPSKQKIPSYLRPLPKSLALRFECPSFLLQNHTVQCSGSAAGSQAPYPHIFEISLTPLPSTHAHSINSLHWH